MNGVGPVAFVVLAGGESRRFGSDKLAADLGGTTLLDRALEGLPRSLPVIVVGPERSLAREVRFVREEPPGGGPGAALVRGLGVALASGAGAIATLPGDAPGAGPGAMRLLARLAFAPSTWAVVAVDAGGQEQPLQLALDASAARALVEAAGEAAGAGASVRRMLAALEPAPTRLALDRAATVDIDTPGEAEAWRTTNRRT